MLDIDSFMDPAHDVNGIGLVDTFEEGNRESLFLQLVFNQGIGACPLFNHARLFWVGGQFNFGEEVVN